MPIYEYKCDECGKISEILVRNTKNNLTPNCPDCQSPNIQRLVSVPGAVMTKGGSKSAPDLPPINCPNMNKCGASASDCPAARMRQ